MAIPCPVRSASATILCAILWFRSVTNRASFLERFFNNRFVDVVPLACSFVRKCWFFFRRNVVAPPDHDTSVDVYAMFTIPKSTPMNPTGF